MTNVLVIGDAHNKPGEDYTRFVKLSNLIVKEQPEYIIIMGDWFEFDSLSSFEKPGSLLKEGARVTKDIESGLIAFDNLWEQIYNLRDTQREQKKKVYTPHVIFLKGNHEERLDRLYRNNAVLNKMIDLDNSLSELVSKIVPYGQFFELENVLFTHIPFKMGKPVASFVNSTGTVLTLVDKSIVYGHTHRLEWKEVRRAGSNKKITAFNVGWFGVDIPKWASKDHPNWWSGVNMLKLDGEGGFDIETIYLERLLREY